MVVMGGERRVYWMIEYFMLVLRVVEINKCIYSPHLSRMHGLDVTR